MVVVVVLVVVVVVVTIALGQGSEVQAMLRLPCAFCAFGQCKESGMFTEVSGPTASTA